MNIELRLPKEVIEIYSRIAELAGVKIETVIKVALARDVVMQEKAK